MKHSLKFVVKETGTCEHGCHTYHSYEVVCSCGWKADVPEIAEYRHKTDPIVSLVLMLNHRVHVLEEALEGKTTARRTR